MKKEIQEIINEQIDNLENLKNNDFCEKIEEISQIIINALKNNKKIMIAGNGGSASDAQHFAGEIVGRFLLERKGMAAIALNTDTSVITCIANDYSYDDIFSRQIEGIGQEGDIFIGISTSGNSQNIINGIEMCKNNNIKTITFLGKDGGKLKNISDTYLLLPYKSTARVQEHHIMAIHLICEIVEKAMTEGV